MRCNVLSVSCFIHATGAMTKSITKISILKKHIKWKGKKLPKSSVMFVRWFRNHRNFAKDAKFNLQRNTVKFVKFGMTQIFTIVNSVVIVEKA